ncbi:unnamed protein product, partial [Mesorhabditis spiculigera]
MIEGIFFYPTLGYNLLRNLLQQENWSWYSQVDEGLILGAMPFKSMKEELIEKGVGGVVCCTESYELVAAWSGMTEEDWKAVGVEFYHIPMTDFVGAADPAEMQKAVAFINKINKEGKSVYVHCKAGRTRSATVTTCHLMQKMDLGPNEAFEFLKKQRRQVSLGSWQWQTVEEYRRYLDANRHLITTAES